MSWKQRWRRLFAGAGTALLTGALFFVVLGRIEKAEGVIELALFGALYALTVLGLMRLLGARGWACLFAGVLCGPVPIAVLWNPAVDSADRGAVLVATVVLGAFIGLFEWARQRHGARDDASAA